MAAQPQPPAPQRIEEAALAAPEREFAFVYLDTEPLRGAAWPMLRAVATTLITLAHDVGLIVCLPEPVEAELAAQFMRDLAAINDKITSNWRGVEGLFRRVNAVPEGAPHRPTAGDARAAYERAVIATCRAHGLERIARSERPLGDYFDLALAQSPPFDADGRGFKDSVVLMSVIDDLCRREIQRGLLVTRDKDFQGIEALVERRGVQLIVRNVDEAVSILRRRLNAADQATYAAAERQALALAQQELSGIVTFISDNLEVPSTVLAEPAEQLLRFLGVHVTTIRGAQADPPFGAQPHGARVKLTYKLRVQLLADVMPIPATLISPRTVKVGGDVSSTSEAENRLVQLMMAREIHARQGHKLVIRDVELDAEATRAADGFENLTPVGVRLKERDLLAEIREIGKLTDRGAPPPSSSS